MTFGSLFAGIGGFDLGLERAGLRSAWNVERETTCRKLLADKFPNAAQYDDVQTVGAHNLAPVDLICGGFPCQDLSVAGQRAGLAGSRSGLFYHLTRITNELQPAFLLWENVPGLLSSDDGRDFARVLMELARIGYHGAWRTLDAQYFGLAQRRRRVFGLFARRDIGAERCAEILSLAEGVRWHPAPRRKAGKGVAPILEAGARTGRSTIDIRAGIGIGNDGHLMFTLQSGKQHAIAPTIPSRERGGGGMETDFDLDGGLVPTIARALCAGRDGYNDGSDQTYIPHIAHSLTTRNERNEPTTETLIPSAQSFNWQSGGDCRGLELKETAQALSVGQIPAAISFQTRIARNGRGQPKDITDALTSADGGTPADSKPHVAGSFGVRRLTPRECERLQGFPDDYTAGFSDSVRYKMLGNAVAVPCAQWIGARITRIYSR